MWWTEIICCAVGLCLFLHKEVRGECEFPHFLREPLPDGSQRSWVTETKFIDNTELWETQLEIVVEAREIVAKLKYKAQCHDYTGTVPCYQREVQYRRFCLTHDGDSRYRVQHVGNGRNYYTCMRFILRNKSIVQIWTSHESEENSDNLCKDPQLTRNDWPWISPVLEEWAFCPVSGGFDFRTYMYHKREKLCEKEWLPSRMESECVRGDGIVFTFPKKACSPFVDHRENVKMQCWGSWEEEDYIFIVAAEQNKLPQYVMRFPRDMELAIDYTADLYFSPVCPLNSRKDHSLREIRQTELEMKRSEPGICYDESDACVEHAQRGKCTNSALHEYANYCKRSCGLCNLLPSTRPECRFPDEYRADWYLWEKDRQETVRIQGGRISFTTLGEFICKAKHWSLNNYKLLSYYTNGCRPRYTCIKLNQGEDMESQSLMYQISRSTTKDESFKLCNFKDDPKPLGGLIRSKDTKTLLAASLTTLRDCGVNGIINVNVSLPGGTVCSGTLSDWNSDSCTSGTKLLLKLPNCLRGSPYIREYQCAGYVNMDAGLSFLFTRDVYEDTYNCWIIRTWPERMSYKPWREAHKLFRTQCGTEDDMDRIRARVSEMSIRAGSDKVHRPCPGQATPAPVYDSKGVRDTKGGHRNADRTGPQYRGAMTEGSGRGTQNTYTLTVILPCIIVSLRTLFSWKLAEL